MGEQGKKRTMQPREGNCKEAERMLIFHHPIPPVNTQMPNLSRKTQTERGISNKKLKKLEYLFNTYLECSIDDLDQLPWIEVGSWHVAR